MRLVLLGLLMSGSARQADAQPSANRDQDGTQREHPEIRELRITGAKHVAVGELRASLASKASSCKSLLLKPFCWITKSRPIYERSYLDRDEFQRDVLRALVFYFRRGYRDVSIDTSIVRAGANAVRITMTVTEGAPTRVTSTGIITTAPVPIDSARLIRPRVNDPLSLLAIDSTVAVTASTNNSRATAVVFHDNLAVPHNRWLRTSARQAARQTRSGMTSLQGRISLTTAGLFITQYGISGDKPARSSSK